MQFMWKISIVNLIRRFYRSIVIIILITISVTGMMFMNGFFEGILSNLKEVFIQANGHIIIEHRKFRDSDLFDDRIKDAAPIIQKIKTLKNIETLSTRLVNEGLLATASTSHFVQITGINLEKEKRLSHLDQGIISGEYNFGKKEKRVIIGSKLAEDLELRVGKKFVVTTQDAQGEIASIGARVSGIVKTDNPQIDGSTIYIPLARAKMLFHTPADLSRIAIRVKDDTQLTQTVSEIQALLPESIRAYSWIEYFPMMGQVKAIYDSFGQISYMIVFTIVGIGIFNIILISVLERLKEYGIMMAIGTPFSRIRWQIVLESLILSGIGAIIGVILGSILLIHYSHVGITYGDAGKALSSFGMGNVIYTHWTFEVVFNAIVAVMVATIISVLLPIRILKKRNPMHVLHMN